MIEFSIAFCPLKPYLDETFHAEAVAASQSHLQRCLARPAERCPAAVVLRADAFIDSFALGSLLGRMHPEMLVSATSCRFFRLNWLTFDEVVILLLRQCLWGV